MRTIIGVVGPSEPTEKEYRFAETLGRLIAKEGWELITGGKGGIMEGASKGAQEENGISIGILPEKSKISANPYVDIAISTGIGEARNFIIANSADALVAVGYSPGTLIELAIASKNGKFIAAYEVPELPNLKFEKVSSPEEAIRKIKNFLRGKND